MELLGRNVEQDDSGNNNDDFLFDSSLLQTISLQSSEVKFDPPVSIESPGNELEMRPLKRLDYTRGYLELLSQLTVVGDVAQQKFLSTFSKMQKACDSYYVTVIEDTSTSTIVGTATLFMEQKFIHGCGKRARIEDVVVSDLHRGKQLGKLLITALTILAKWIGCYKISLDCRDKMIPFYGSLGFVKEEGNGNSMTIRF